MQVLKLLNQLIERFRKHWSYKYILFAFVYGLLLDFIAAVLFGFKFGILEIFAFGFLYYFFRFELFEWIKGVRS